MRSEKCFYSCMSEDSPFSVIIQHYMSLLMEMDNPLVRVSVITDLLFSASSHTELQFQRHSWGNKFTASYKHVEKASNCVVHNVACVHAGQKHIANGISLKLVCVGLACGQCAVVHILI